jgi:hypothetical protein
MRSRLVCEHSARTAASRFAAAALVAIGVLGAWSAAADVANGSLCRVREVQVINTGKSMIREQLWGYTGDKAPYDPVFGWVEMACADRGVSRTVHQDLGTRIWFNVAGPEGAPADKAKISFGSEAMRAEGSTLGLAVDGLNLLGEVSPRHSCVFVVTVWSESCPEH